LAIIASSRAPEIVLMMMTGLSFYFGKLTVMLWEIITTSEGLMPCRYETGLSGRSLSVAQ
jgi:hypothetical protein